MHNIHIVTAANARYIPHVGAMLHSLFNSNPKEHFVVHFLHRESLNRGELTPLQTLCNRFKATLQTRAVAPALLQGLPIKGRYVEEAWYRVILPQLIPDEDKLLWLDADTIIRRPIRELWSTDMQGLPLAACPNALLYSAKDDVLALGIKDRQQYFNTGVLLIDAKQMRAEHSDIKLKQAATDYEQWIHFADQDVLNCVYHGRCKRLELTWNFLSHSLINVPETKRVHGLKEYQRARSNPHIVHFTGPEGIKPWAYRCGSPYRTDYLLHRQAAGWPAPDFSGHGVLDTIIQKIPMRPREILKSIRRRKWGQAKSYIRTW